jgi:hypothetical protein
MRAACIGLGRIVALYSCTATHPLYTIFTIIFGTFFFLKRHCDRTPGVQPTSAETDFFVSYPRAGKHLAFIALDVKVILTPPCIFH